MDGATLQCGANNIQLSLAEVKLAWTVRIVAAILMTNQISGFSGEFEAEFSARVWQLINVTNSGWITHLKWLITLGNDIWISVGKAAF
nr:hypothetical protein CFP56_71530 [Quercus suber]